MLARYTCTCSSIQQTNRQTDRKLTYRGLEELASNPGVPSNGMCYL